MSVETVSSDKVSSLLKTKAGAEAFEKINALRPAWHYGERNGEIFLGSEIDFKPSNENVLCSVGRGWGKSADEIIVSLAREIQAMAAKDKQGTIVVNAISRDRREYRYEGGSFTRLTPEPTPGDVRAMLSDEFAFAAFDRLDAMWPEWTVNTGIKSMFGSIEIAPAIKVSGAMKGKDGLASLSTTRGENPNAIIKNVFAEVVKLASVPGAVVVVNPGTKKEAQYKIDVTFSPAAG